MGVLAILYRFDNLYVFIHFKVQPAVERWVVASLPVIS